MKYCLVAATLLVCVCTSTDAQKRSFSAGSRAVVSLFNDDKIIGKGIGGQLRYQFGDKLNSEWFADIITSTGAYTSRTDYHAGWSLLFYPSSNYAFNHLLQPYLLAGHCIDISKVSAKTDPPNYASRFSMAVQAGLGTHINITPRFDCSVTGQYMLHLGRPITTTIDKDIVLIEKQPYSQLDGHLLFSLSFNYKFARM